MNFKKLLESFNDIEEGHDEDVAASNKRDSDFYKSREDKYECPKCGLGLDGCKCDEEIDEADFRNMKPDSAFGDDEEAAANLRWHLEQAEKYAMELGNQEIASAVNSFLEVSRK